MSVYFITGGGGFVGSRLCDYILEQEPNARCVLVDINFSGAHFYASSVKTRDAVDTLRNARVEKRVVDITSAEDMREALVDNQFGVPDCVFHIASYGMSGASVNHHARIEQVNVRATEQLLKLCDEVGVGCFVHCSSYNAVFCGDEIVNGDENRVPYPDLSRHTDGYSRSKTKAEQLVLQFNSSSEQLKTCAIRPAAIYGDGEERHFPRIVKNARQGLLYFGCSSRSSLVDWVYVDNLSHGFLCAARAMRENDEGTNSSSVCGHAFAISDHEAMNNFAFLRLILQELGYSSIFEVHLPLWIFLMCAILCEIAVYIASVVGIFFEPFLMRVEVYKVGVTHFFSPSRARNRLKYDPIVSVEQGVRRTADYLREHGFAAKNS